MQSIKSKLLPLVFTTSLACQPHVRPAAQVLPAAGVLPKIWHYNTAVIDRLLPDSTLAPELIEAYVNAQRDTLEQGMCIYGEVRMSDSTIVMHHVKIGNVVSRTAHSVDFSCDLTPEYLGRAHTHLRVPPEMSINEFPSDVDHKTAWADQEGIIYLTLTGFVTDGNGNFGLRVHWQVRDGREGESIFVVIQARH